MNSRQIMFYTLAALLPGFFCYAWFYGTGILVNVFFCAMTAIATEALMLQFRKLPIDGCLDGTALLTGVLLGLCLPPLLPLWMACLGTMFALIFGKHIYGGTGQNIFNPAMTGFAVLIISFPLAMSQWPAPEANHSDFEAMTSKLSLSASASSWDGVTSATPLDAYKFRQGETNDEFFSDSSGNNIDAWLFINLSFLLGGLILVYLKIINWRIPVAYLGTLVVLSALFYDSGSSNSLGSPLFHLTTGATMLAAFFILTDPVTCPALPLGHIIFGVCAGIMVFVIRSIGAYPEGIAFAVLLLNGATPLIDHYLLRSRSS